MKTKKWFCAAMAAICLMTGCASNPMLAVYDDNKLIASDTNTYNLINVEQLSESGHFIYIKCIFR